jgi:hypothetical protein
VIAQIDYDSLIMFRGGAIDPVRGQIHEPELQLPPGWAGLSAPRPTRSDASPAAATTFGPEPAGGQSIGGESLMPGESQHLRARMAIWQPATDLHPAGFLLQGVRAPFGGAGRESLVDQDKFRVLLPGDQPWLAADQCFVPTPLSVWQLALGAHWFRSASLGELVAINRSGSVRLPSVQRVEIHWRLLRPILDFLLVLIGLPLVLRPEGQKLVVAAGYCGLLMLGVQLLVMGSHFLGGQQILRPAALAAWLPVLVLVPWAAWFYQKFDF